MASAGVNMPGGGDGNPTAASSSSSSTPECRMRRRRRIAPPPRAATVASEEKRVVRPSEEEGQEGEADDGAALLDEEEGGTQQQQQQPAPGAVAAPAWPVAFGWLSVAGRSREMEDAVSIRPGFCTWVDGSPMHFFGVFDGHGGSHVSTLCRDRMHEFLAEELAAEGAAFVLLKQQQQAEAQTPEGEAGAGTTTTSAGAARPQVDQEDEAEERAWRAALGRTFRRVDALASLACACGRIARPPCRCPLSGNSGIVGSTAVVAVLVRGRVVVANCGDSRAVLCRGPAGVPPVPLSRDHKPNRPDELARIEAAGGRVLYINGHRVRGILAMSRALGDRMLRPEVIAEPEITVTDRTPEDQCLILASDGMWDVISNEIACSVARQCLEDGNPAPVDDAAPAAGDGEAAGPEPEARCSRAASLLVRLALGRTTWDNVSVVIIDLKQRE